MARVRSAGKAVKIGKPVDGYQTYEVPMSDGTMRRVKVAIIHSSPGALARKLADQGEGR